MQLHSLLLTYGNWRSRYVHAHPRTAHISSKLQASPKLTEHKAAVDPIVAAIKAGHDLTPHLARHQDGLRAPGRAGQAVRAKTISIS